MLLTCVYLRVRVIYMYSNSCLANIGTWNFRLSDKLRKSEKKGEGGGEKDGVQASFEPFERRYNREASLVRIRTEHDSCRMILEAVSSVYDERRDTRLKIRALIFRSMRRAPTSGYLDVEQTPVAVARLTNKVVL